MKYFIKRFLILLMVGLVINLIIQFLPLETGELSLYFWWNLIFFFVITTVVFIFFQYNLIVKRPNLFLAAVMGGLLIKIFFSAVYFIVAYKLFEIDAGRFLISFGLYYVIFTVAETVFLDKAVRMVPSRED